MFNRQKVGNTWVVPVTVKILIIFVCMLLFSTLSSSFVLITLSQRQVINLTNTIMVDKLKELYSNASNQWQIYQYSQKKDECLDSLKNVALKGFQMEHSVALGVDKDGNVSFFSVQETSEEQESEGQENLLLRESSSKIADPPAAKSLPAASKNENEDGSIQWDVFADTLALENLNQNAENGIYEGSVVFNGPDGEYFGVYKWHDEWNMYIIRAESRADTQHEMWRLFAINTIIIAVLILLFSVIGVKLLRHVLKNIQGFTDDLFEMQNRQQLSLIDLSSAPNDDITYMAASFNSLSSSISNLINTFQKFVSKDVAAKAYEEHGIALEGSQKELTILFSDIKSFTFRTETLGNEIISLLNVHYNRVIHQVHENKGVIGSIIGDAILAIYGTQLEKDTRPNAEKQKSFDAVRSAWEITDVTSALRSAMSARRSEIEKDRPLTESEEKVYQAVLLDVGVGIDGGSVFYGNIGSSEHMANTVIGDNVNSASRLEGLTRVYHLPVIVSEYIKDEAEKVTDKYHFYEIDTVQVKGKTQGKKIFFPLDPERATDETYNDDAKWAVYEHGLKAYYEGNWKEARRSFKECALEVSEVFLDRMGLKSAPEGWNGIWTMKSK